MPVPATPSLSIGLGNHAAEDPDGWDHLTARARIAEQLGVDRVLVSDHVVFGSNLEAYGRPELGGTEGGRQPTGPDGHWLEPLTVLAVVAGLTTRVRLGTSVLQAALRRPVVLAKTAATLDVLSGGRLDLGVGVGWQREEYEAAGLDFHERGRLLDHTLEVCRTLWLEGPVDIDLGGLHARSITAMPQPLQPGGVPIWVSGTVHQRMLERLVRFGSGWIPWGPDAKDPVPGIRRIREAFTAADRDPAGLQVQGRLPVVADVDQRVDIARTMAAVPSLVAAGITDFRLNANPEDSAAAAEHLAELVVAFRETVGRPAA